MTTYASDSHSRIHGLLREIGVTPRGVQIDAINKGLLEGRSIMVCSPTGSGKTLVGEMGLLRAIEKGRPGMYLVPLRALATQVAGVLKDRYEEHSIRVEVSTGDFHLDLDILSDKDILVTTYERADSLLRHRCEWLSKVGTVVIDEVQNLSDVSRGARLESVIIRLRALIEDLQIVALSATVGMPELLADWLDADLIESDDRPVPLVCDVIEALDKDRMILKAVMTTVQANGQVIVFHRTRRESEAEAERLSESVSRQLVQREKVELDDEMDSVENWGVSLPQGFRALMHNGVAYHNAGLSARARRLIESLFRKGLLRVLCATTTLASGMDLPARTVVLTSIASPSDYRSALPTNQVHQMLGRAGRPGRDRKGFGLILTGSKGEAEQAKEAYFHITTDPDTELEVLEPRYEPVQSTLWTSSAMTEQLLVALCERGEATLEQLENGFFSDSYLVHTAIRDGRSPMRVLHLGEITAESAIEKHALQDTVRAARQGALGSVEIRERGEEVLGGIVDAQGGGHYTCRFSARYLPSGAIEGPMCSCVTPVDRDGLLCPHLVALGYAAAREARVHADYIIPLALSETSPLGTLVRLGLVEGAEGSNIRPTRLGRLVNRLYLSIRTVRELLATMPVVDDSIGLMSLLRHIVSIETGRKLDEDFEQMVGMVVTTKMRFNDIAKALDMSVGDVYALLDTVVWILQSIGVIADLTGLARLQELSELLLNRVNERTERRREAQDDIE